jgi:addiction module RelE/StbE family toxin
VKRRRFRVRWSQVARSDLFRILDYVLDRYPDEAEGLLDRIEDKASALRTMPQRGRIVPELARLQLRDYREIQIPPYRLLYRVVGAEVVVPAVFDSRRNLEDVILERILTSP